MTYQSKNITRDEITNELAEEFGFTKAKTKRFVLDIEEIIVEDIKQKSRVRINNFGTFQIKNHKSRTIKSVATKKNKLLLEQKHIKFSPCNELRAKLNGNLPTEKKPKIVTENREPAVKIKKNISHTSQANPYKQTIHLPPLKYKPPVEKARVKKIIEDKILALAKAQMQEPSKKDRARDQVASARVFRALFRKAIILGSYSIDFSFDPEKKSLIDIYCGRPRQKIGSVPSQVVADYLDLVMDIQEFDIPQQRFAKMLIDSKINKKLSLVLHSFPTYSGIAVHININD